MAPPSHPRTSTWAPALCVGPAHLPLPGTPRRVCDGDRDGLTPTGGGLAVGKLLGGGRGLATPRVSSPGRLAGASSGDSRQVPAGSKEEPAPPTPEPRLAAPGLAAPWTPPGPRPTPDSGAAASHSRGTGQSGSPPAP